MWLKEMLADKKTAAEKDAYTKEFKGMSHSDRKAHDLWKKEKKEEKQVSLVPAREDSGRLAAGHRPVDGQWHPDDLDGRRADLHHPGPGPRQGLQLHADRHLHEGRPQVAPPARSRLRLAGRFTSV